MLFAATTGVVKRQIAQEWRGGPLYRLALAGPTPQALAAAPRDHRPPDLTEGRSLLFGRLTLVGATLEIGQGGDPWDTASPSRHFAVELHRFAWLPGLLAIADPRLTDRATREALRLSLDWIEMFAPVTPFAWGAEVLERRVFNLACGAQRLVAIASDAERQRLLESVARQARGLLKLDDDKTRGAERAVVASIAGAAFAGKAGEALLARALPRAMRALKDEVLPDGGVRTRSPEQALELLLDLQTLDDVLMQRGRNAPDEVSRAIDRLSGAVRFFTLGDGRLATFQGGAASSVERVSASLAPGDADERRIYGYAPHSGYHRLAGKTVLALIDAAPPAEGAWSTAACGQPLALEVTCGADRMIVNSGWSPDAQGPQAMRLASAASTASLGEASVGAPLSGFAARGLGAQLVGGAEHVAARRNENEAGVWIELSHDGWSERFGVTHERRLFLDLRHDELRGEDRFLPISEANVRQRMDRYTIRFHLAPEVQVSLARDERSVLLRGPSNRGWWFRNDAPEVALEPSVHFEHGLPRRTLQIVLRGQLGLTGEAHVRWKLAPVDPAEFF